MRRRQLLARGTALLSVVIAGCGHPPVVLDMDTATASDIADEVSIAAESEEYTVVTSARENGTATRSGRNELFDRTDIVQVDSAVYTVSETRLESNEVTVYRVVVKSAPDNSTASLGEIEYDDLPEIDRQQLRPIVSDNPTDRGGNELGVEYGTVEEVGNESVLVPERQHDIIVHGDHRYQVTVDSRATSEGEYQYEVTEIAPDIETFAEQVREQYLFALTGLSDAEHAVVEEAIDGGYFEDDDDFQSVTDRIRDHEGIDVADFYGTWLVEYEGVEYLTYAEW